MWLFISKTKRICFWIWLGFFLAILTLTLLQTFTGKLEGMLGLAWTWLLINALPGLALLFIGVLLDRQTAKLIPRLAHRVLIAVTMVYLLLLFFTVLLEEGATQGDFSMQDYRIRSFLWLGPVQLILLVGYWSLFFWKKSIFYPSQADLRQTAEREARRSTGPYSEMRQQAFDLIAESQIEEALEKISAEVETKGVGDLNELVLLQARWKENKRKERMDILAPEDIDRNYNQMTVALMEYLNRL